MISWENIWDKKYQNNDHLHVQAGFDDLSLVEWKKLVNTFSTIIGLNNKSNILDIGCGSGAFIENIKEFNSISGIDYSTSAINNINKIFNGNFIVGQASELPFEDNSFNIVICFSVVFYFNSVEYTELCINEMIRVCTPKGRIFIGDINDINKMELYNNIRAEENRDEKHIFSVETPQHLFFSKDFFQSIANKNNLNIRIIDEDKLDLSFYTSSNYRFSVIFDL